MFNFKDEWVLFWIFVQMLAKICRLKKKCFDFISKIKMTHERQDKIVGELPIFIYSTFSNSSSSIRLSHQTSNYRSA